MMYKSNYGKEKVEQMSKVKMQSVDDYLAKGGKISTAKTGLGKRSKPHTIDAQVLLDKFTDTEHEEEVIKFLRSKGIKVENR
jgi:hypothetical protein